MLDLTDEGISQDWKAGRRNLGDFNPHHEESESNEEDSAKEIEET